MVRITLRFYAELNDFLPPARRHTPLPLQVPPTATIKDVIESQGVPHTEVDLILAEGSGAGGGAEKEPGRAEGEPVDFAYRVRDGDRFAVYPRFRTLDLGPLPRLRPPPLPEPRFILDTHLGALATLLRLLGFDARYRNDYDDPTLAALSRAEGRILLTRDRGLLKRSAVTHGYHVWETDPERQALEVLRRFDLFGAATPFRRCLRCNGRLVPVPKAEVLDRLPPLTRRYYEDFSRCTDCGRIYWKGAHFKRMGALVERLLQQRPPG